MQFGQYLCEVVVDYYGGNCCYQIECGGQQCFGDVWGDYCQMGGVGISDVDEVVYDVLYGVEQFYEWSDCVNVCEYFYVVVYVLCIGQFDMFQL